MKRSLLALLLAANTPLALADYFPFPIPGNNNSADYSQGYRDGFRDGYNRGRQDALNGSNSWNNQQGGWNNQQGGSFGNQSHPNMPFPGTNGGGRNINVVGAMYGDYSNDCDATRWVASQAAGRMFTTFEVTNSMCGDPARGQRKTLRVRYYCGPDLREASAVEHRSVTLDCTSYR